MKNILIVNTCSTGYNGITSVILNYVRHTYTEVKYDFVLCGTVVESYASELRKMGNEVFVAPCSRVKHPLKYMQWLSKILNSKKYDAIHVHGNSATTYIEIHSAKKANITKRIVHSHSTTCKHMLVHKLLKKRMNREITDAIACSDMAGKWLFTKEFAVLPNAIDIEKFKYDEQIRKSYRDEMELGEKLVIGHVGYMDVEKNHFFLLRVMKELVKVEKNAKLLLIGDGKLRTDIEQFIVDNSLSEYVILLGKRSDVAELYQCMDVFVLPSFCEGLPVTSVEAQTAGLPCFISSNVTRQVSITEKVKYIGIQDDDVAEWVENILNIKSIDRKSDFDKIRISDFNIENSKEKLLSIYR